MNASFGSHVTNPVSTRSVSRFAGFARLQGTAFTLLVLLLLGAAASSLRAQTANYAGTVNTFDAAPATTGPEGGTFDSAGNFYEADALNGTVWEVAVNSGNYQTPVQLVPNGTFQHPLNVAVDPGGNVWVADLGTTTGQVYEIVNTGGTLATAATAITGGTAWVNPAGIFADAAGNIWVTDNGAGTLSEITGANPTWTVTTENTGLGSPYGLTIDPSSGTMYIASGSHIESIDTPPYTAPPTQIGPALSLPLNVSIDAYKNLWVAEYDANAVAELTVASGYTTAETWGTGLNGPVQALPDNYGNIIVPNYPGGPVDQLSTGAASLGSTAATAGSTTATVTFNFTGTSTSIGTPVIVSPVTGEFTDAGTGTCTTTNGIANPYLAGTSCTVVVGFAPTLTGMRSGAVKLEDTTGVVLATAYVYGFGTGPQITFDAIGQPPTAFSATFNAPSGLAADGAGNVYVANTDANQILEEPAGTAFATSSVLSPQGVAVDALGNVFIADTGNHRVVEIVNGTLTQLATSFTFSSPTAIALDQNGNVFVADGGSNNAIEEILAVNGYTNVRTLTTTSTTPLGIAVDYYDDVYYVTSGATTVTRLQNVNGVIPASPTSTTIGTFTSATAVAVDGNNNLYVLDGGTTISEFSYTGSSPYYANTPSEEIITGLTNAAGIAVDGKGNVYYTNAGTDNKTYKIDLADAPTLTFNASAYQTTSSDSPKSVVIANLGGGSSSTLNFASLAVTTTTGGATNSFAEVAGSGTPADCSSTPSLAPGTACDLSLSFTPQASGAIAGTAIATDNNLNATAVAQTITLNGGGLIIPTLSVSNPSVTYNGAAQAATVVPSVPGTVSNVMYNGSATVPTAAGTYAVTADFVPSDPTTYSSLTGASAGDFVINKATPTLSVSNSPAPYTGSPVAASVEGSVLGTVSAVLYNGSSTVPTAAATYVITASFVPNDTTDYNSLTAASAGDFVIGKVTPTLSITNSPVTYNGNPQAATVMGSVPGTPSSVLYNGSATVPTAAGSYTVTANFTPNDPADYNSLTAASAGTFVISKATLTLSVSNSPVIYTGVGQAATVVASAAGIAGHVAGTPSAVLYNGSATLPIAAGSYPVTATFTPTDAVDYSTVTAASAGNFVINKATLTLSITNSPATYTGVGQSAAIVATAAGITGNVAGTPSAVLYNGSATLPITAGTYPVTATFTPTDTVDYSTVTAGSAGSFVIGKATPTLSVSNSPVTYNGTPQAATVIGSVPGTPSSVLYNGSATVPTTGGTYAITANFAPTDTVDYNTLTAASAGNFVIGKATPTLHVTNSPVNFTGTAQAATVAGSVPGTPSAVLYNGSATVPSAAGTYAITANFVPTDTTDYASLTAASAGNFVISTIAPTITFTIPNHTFGDAPFVVSATSNSTGAISYSVVSGPATLVGATVTLTGAGTVVLKASQLAAGSYIAGSQNATFMVTVGTPVITWHAPAAIAYGTALSATQLDATANVGGTFLYTPAAGIVLPAGANQTLSVAFTPTDTTDYKATTGTTTITVTGGSLTVSANNATRVYGTANPTFSGSVTGAQNGDTFTESFVTSATITSNAGTYAIVPSAAGTNLADYTVVTDNGTLTITRANTTTGLTASGSTVNPGATVTLTATVASATSGTPTGTVSFYDGTTLLGTGTLTGGVATYATTTLAAGVSHTITAVYGGDINFNGSTTTTSTGITVGVLDFTLGTPTPASQTGSAGTAFTYSFSVTPTYASYAGTVNFTATGLPSGTVATFSPASIPANGGPQTVSLILATAAGSAALVHPSTPGRGLIPVALAFLFLPLAGTKRMRREGRRFGRMACLLLLVLAGLGATVALTGCGSHAGFSNNAQSYTVTITATSGAIQHTATVNLDLNQ
ncbi:MAG TPA: MBG domain-containing protein [Acidobacteriaceae bacterium]|jgi:hypothetical protein|nr:MBG domain-containing protein [Acidobacteriaceae bacterium]